MTGGIVFGGSTGFGGTEIAGGRHCARGTNGTIWIVSNELSGTNTELAIYYLAPGSLVGIREVVRASSAIGITGAAICMDTLDRPVVTYVEAGTSILKTKRRESDVWTAKANFTAQTNNCASFQILCRTSGTFDLVLADYRSAVTSGLLKHMSSTDDLATWGAVTNVVTSATSTASVFPLARRLAACLDHTDQIHCAYDLRTATTWPVAYVKFSGGSWGSPETIESQSLSPATMEPKEITIAADQNGVPYVAWTRQSRLITGTVGVWYSTRLGGSWAAPEQIHDSVAFDCGFPSITVDQVANVECWFRGQGLLTTNSYDVLYRAVKSGTWTITMPLDPGVRALDPETPHNWRPRGHGFYDSGYFCSIVLNGMAPIAVQSDDVSWTMEPFAGNSASGAQASSLPSKLSHPASGAGGSQIVTISREKNVACFSYASGSQKMNIPAARNIASGSQAVSLAGTVRHVSAANTASGAQFADTVSPALCETTFVPSPAIPANDSDLGKTFISGPYPLLTRKIQMPLPDYGDTRNVVTRVLNLTTRHGEVKQRQQTSKRRSFRVGWTTLSRKKCFELDDFLNFCHGSPVQWTDANGYQWIAVIVDPAARITRNSDYFAGAFELNVEGTFLR